MSQKANPAFVIRHSGFVIRALVGLIRARSRHPWSEYAIL